MSSTTFTGRPLYVSQELVKKLAKLARKKGDTEERSPSLPTPFSPFARRTDLSCPWCSRLDVKIETRSPPKIPVGKHTYKCLFHSVCRRRPEHGSSLGSFPSSTCDFCRHLDLFHVIHCFVPLVLERPMSREDIGLGGFGQLVASVELATDWYHEQSLAADCDFCRFVAGIAGAKTNIDHVGLVLEARMYHSRGLSKMNISLDFNINVYFDSGKMKIKSPLFRSVHDSFWEPTKPLDREIDWELVRAWFSAEPAKSPHAKRLLPEFRVIDVERNCIVKPDNPVDYVTLSYVWGASVDGELKACRENIHELEVEGSLLHHDIPATIKDAMAACNKLGQRYLWVDRLCIPQVEDPKDPKDLEDAEDQKMRSASLGLIEQMDSVYGSSNFTIVAVSAGDARGGLSGMSRHREANLDVLRWQSFELIQPFPQLHKHIVGKSIWNTRGWTYQEAMCSKSCLYFTDYGVFLSDKEGHVMSERPASRDNSAKPATGYFSAVEQYTKRSLTKPTDILRAFKGVLNSLFGTKHYYGLPVDLFAEAILWEPVEWGCEVRNSTADHIFPTWSWISVIGAVAYPGVYMSSSGISSVLKDIMGSTEFGQDHSMIQPVASWAFVSSSQLSAMPFQDERAMRQKGIGTLAWNEGLLQKEYFDWDKTQEKPIRHRGGQKPDFLNAFTPEDVQNATSFNGGVLVRTQSAALVLGAECGRRAFMLRTSDGALAGMVRVLTSTAEVTHQALEGRLQFLALSLSAPREMHTMRNVLGDIRLHLENFPDCRTQPRARSSVHEGPVQESPQDKEAQDQAWDEYEKELMYDGADTPPQVDVMLIAREDKVATRLGIGKVYLKRWVQSKRTFTTAILK